MRCSSPGMPGSGGLVEAGGLHGDASDGCWVKGSSVPLGNDGGRGRRGLPDRVPRNAHRSWGSLDTTPITAIDLPGPVEFSADLVGMAMQYPVMVAAQQQQVVQLRRASLGPANDMVGV